MAEHPIFAFMAALIIGYGLFSKKAEKSIFSAPMAFVVAGVLVSFFSVPLLKEGVKAPFVKLIAELTLVLVLFIDASAINLRRLIRERSLPLRLLGIGLPVTMALGVLIAIPLFPDQPIWALMLMAFILSPTDAALGQAVVKDERVPEKIRQTINVESGLNDGIALPPILVCLGVLAGTAGETLGTGHWFAFTVKQFVYGPAIGGMVGWVGGYLIDLSTRRGWMNRTFQRLASVSIALLAYTLAESAHGNGFIAAYFAGLLLGTHTEEIRDRIREFGEAESQAMELFIFLLFGIIVIPMTFHYWDGRALIYALLSLTAIRMVPVALSLWGSGLMTPLVWFIGWFGPRGIASVLYLLMAAMQLGVPGYERIFSVITLTITLSIFLHGLTAVPFTRMLKKR